MADAPRFRVVVPEPMDVHTEEDIRSGVHAPISGERPSDDAILESLIAERGRIVRVCAKLGISEELVIRVATKNIKKLTRMASAHIMLSSFTTVMALDETLRANVEDLPLDTLGRTYSASLAAFNQISSRFDDEEVEQVDDDATAAKESMLERLGEMGKREAAARALMEQESAG